MTTWFRELRWLPVGAVLLIIAGFVLVVVDKTYYPIATILLLAAVVLAVLTGKEKTD